MSAPRRNVAYNKPAEPSFLKAFKAKVGYREPVSIDAKREPPPSATVPQRDEDDGQEEREDEMPTVVVLRKGDVTLEEYQEFHRRNKEDASHGGGEDLPAQLQGPSPRGASMEGDSGSAGPGKIVFKKPAKRKSSEGGGGGVLDASTKKPKTDEGSRPSHRTSPGSKVKAKGVKNNSLLSFGDEEEDT